MIKPIQDKKGRIIILEIDDYYKMTAMHDGNIVGEFDYRMYEVPKGYGDYTDEFFELCSMNIINNYQRAGIGTEMIRFGEEKLERVSYPKDDGSRHGNHLSSEGKYLIDSCIIKGIISVSNEIDDGYDEYY